MALNAKQIKRNGGSKNFVEQAPLEVGNYPARVQGIIDLGVQQQMPYKNVEKKPAHMIMLCYELSDEFMVDENGEELTDKPRFLSEDFPFCSLDMDMAKSTKRYNALDPDGLHDGDFTLLADTPCNLAVIQKERKSDNRIFNNVSGVSAMRPKDAARAPALVNEPRIFLLDDPDIDVFLALPEYVQNRIKSNLEFSGSLLETRLAGVGKDAAGDDDVEEEEVKPKRKAVKAKVVEPEDEEVEGDDAPW